MNKVINKEFTKKLKINDLLQAVIHSKYYNENYDKYDDTMTLQKDTFKNYIIPKIKEAIETIININNDFDKIEITNIKSKYSRNEKYIEIELFYNNDKMDIISISQKILSELIKQIRNKLIDYDIFY